MASLFNITISDVSVTEGGSVTITLTPISALSQAVTVSWSILGIGRLPISAGDFSNLTGSLSFASGTSSSQTFTLTPTNDTSGELAKEFLVRFSQDAGGTPTDLEVTLEDDDGVDKSSYISRSTRSTNENDVMVMEGTTGATGYSGDVGDDILIVTRHQYNDVTINDTLGSNTIKFDYGVEITSFDEESNFFGIGSVRVTLASGANITVTTPTQTGRYEFQFGDEAAMDYDAFKAALTAGGVEADKSLTTPFVVDYPSDVTTVSYAFANKSDYVSRSTRSTNENDVMVMEGTTGSTGYSGDVGNDILIVTRHQYNDVTINDTLGSNTIKFDYGVEITSFDEESNFFGIGSVRVTLASGANITVTTPTQTGRYQYQFGDEAVMDYDAFKAALTAGGVDSVTGTLTTPFVVEYPSKDIPITYPDPIPDPEIDFSTYNNITGTSGDDTIDGTANADYFHNLGGGSDTLNGGDGNDLFLSDGAYDRFNGGGGIDTVSYANANSYVTARLGGKYANISGVGLETSQRDRFDSIENLIGSDYNDQLFGSDGDNQIEGGDGDDRVNGGSGGRNILYGGDGTDRLIGANNAGSHNTFIGGANNDTFVLGQQNGITDIIKDFTPGDGDKIRFLIGNGANKNSLDAIFNDSYVNHQSTTTDIDFTGNGALDTVLTFDTNPFISGHYQLILEGYTAPLLIDYISVEVDA